MPNNRFGRLIFAILVCTCLFVIGRNFYRRHLNSRLIDAVIARDAAATRRLLDQGADPNSRSNEEILGLHDLPVIEMMSLSNNGPSPAEEQILCLLIRHGANLHPMSSNSGLDLTYACDKGCVDLTRCLLERGADPRGSYSGAGTPLSAVVAGYVKTARDKGATQKQAAYRQIIALLRGKGVPSTLPDAAAMGDRDALQAALKAGETVNVRRAGKGEFSPALEQAITAGQIETVRWLLAQGAEVSRGEYEPPLSLAMNIGQEAIARLLLAHGAMTDPVGVQGGYLPLVCAIDKMPELVPELLARGANVNAAYGLPLLTAIGKNRPAIVRLLLQKGARSDFGTRKVPSQYGSYSNMVTLSIAPRASTSGSINGAKSRGMLPTASKVQAANLGQDTVRPGEANPKVEMPSPLTLAVARAPECVDILLKAGAGTRTDRRQSLLIAAETGHASLFPRLLAGGADPNAQGSLGETPLTLAVQYAPAGVQTLLEHGANPNSMTEFQRTPLILAVNTQNAEAVRLLLTHGANVNAHPSRNHTALYHARKKQNTAIVALLEKAGATDDR